MYTPMARQTHDIRLCIFLEWLAGSIHNVVFKVVLPNMSITPSQYFLIPFLYTVQFGNSMACAQYCGSTG